MLCTWGFFFMDPMNASGEASSRTINARCFCKTSNRRFNAENSGESCPGLPPACLRKSRRAVSGLGGAVWSLALAGEGAANKLYPPGSGDPERFFRRCAGCQLCAATCPAGIIKPTLLGFGPVHLDYSAGCCEYDCVRCGSACPTGALERLSVDDKHYTRIGVASAELGLCRVVAEHEACDLCARACPPGAIYMADGPDGIPIPEVNTFHCIGCGACQSVCPVRPRAITVEPIGEQRMMW